MLCCDNSKGYRGGRKAGGIGVERHKNPYRQECDLKEHWYLGWEDGHAAEQEHIQELLNDGILIERDGKYYIARQCKE